MEVKGNVSGVVGSQFVLGVRLMFAFSLNRIL